MLTVEEVIQEVKIAEVNEVKQKRNYILNSKRFKNIKEVLFTRNNKTNKYNVEHQEFINIDISDLEKGIYDIKINDNGKTVNYKKFTID